MNGKKPQTKVVSSRRVSSLFGGAQAEDERIRGQRRQSELLNADSITAADGLGVASTYREGRLFVGGGLNHHD